MIKKGKEDMMIYGKTILTDADGVLLNWRDSFDAHMMRQHGLFAKGDVREYDQSKRFGIDKDKMKEYIKEFNASANIGFLAPLYDSVKYVEKFYKEHGYTFVVITSLSLNTYAQRLRTQNLKNIFGNAIDEIVYLDTGADKDEILEKYSKIFPEAYWIEDKIQNAIAGQKVGLEPILIKHPHTKLEDTFDVPVMPNWKSIYERIIGE